MIKITLIGVEHDLLRPYLERNVTGLGTLTVDALVEKINALPDATQEKALLRHYWERLCLALSQDNAEAIAGWLTALALATHTAGFLLPKAASRVKSSKPLNSGGRAAGTASTKMKASSRNMEIRRIVEREYRTTPGVKAKQFGRYANELDVAESTLVKKAAAILRALRKE